MLRLVVYALVWLICTLAMAFCMAGLAALAMFYTVLGPFACLYVGARIGEWCGLGLPLTAALMLAFLGLFGSVRVTLYRLVRRRWGRGLRFIARTRAFRADLWRQYRLARQHSEVQS